MREHTATTQRMHDETERTINTDADVDLLDLQILVILRDAPLWKQQVANQIDTVSVQTVCRRVDTLRDNGLLESCIISPDDIKRDLIIAFTTTEQGCAALQTHLVCTDPDCDDLKRPTEHVHEYVPAQEYF